MKREDLDVGMVQLFFQPDEFDFELQRPFCQALETKMKSRFAEETEKGKKQPDLLVALMDQCKQNFLWNFETNCFRTLL